MGASANEYSVDNLAKEGYYIVWSRTYTLMLFEIRCFNYYGSLHYSSYATPLSNLSWSLGSEFKQVDKVRDMLNSGNYSAYDASELCKELLG